MVLIDLQQLQSYDTAAQYLLGCQLWRTLKSGEILKVRIVETESYHQEDEASHTFAGKSPRNSAMFGPPGHAYVYFTYGMHWCFNVTTGPEGYGAGVLIRAAEPLAGVELMYKNRGLSTNDTRQLTNGPAKLAQALQINKSLYGHDLSQPPLQLSEPTNRDFKVTETTRVGISKAKDTIARYYITDNPYVSKK
jgi:DNA-3-methyladenine glycosylase